ncbi:Hypothetical Protein FCC1311_031502 [Hondaea fermentalgiana]|uniref:Uncharacterized protein n=1 Tax=Hondaea fermentalgiana TaxID=2315210 RepID=A0A2R5G7A0_9STRA|nr:Hypothetical Protein FCC1311_031502 [Hondaea fermentalgiana]|eukprot:GBG26927.1 Hypothetical Protein FCC1311_031502 [Hondaea fermentalgiana]
MAGEELSREDFVALLVAQLRANEEAAVQADVEEAAAVAGQSSAAETPAKREQLAQKAFRELGFDFPLVSDRALAALAATLRSSGESNSPYPSWLWVSPDVLEGVRFCLHEREKDQVSPAARADLQRINVALRLGLLERIADASTSPAERRRLLLGPTDLGDDDGDNDSQIPIPASTHDALVRRFCAALRTLSYQPFSGLSLTEWDDLFVAGSLFRLLRSVLGLRERAFWFFDASERRKTDDDAESQSQIVSWATDAQAVWPQFLLVLRDRLTDQPQAMRTVLPALLEMADLCHAHCLKVETSVAHADAAASLGANGNPVVMGVLKTLAAEDALATASLQDKAMLWEALHRRIVPHAMQLFQSTLERSKDEEPQAREQMRGLLDVLAFYALGDPRRGAFGAANAIAMLQKVGIIRAAAASWCQGHFGAGGVDDPLGAFLWTCALRSPSVLSYLVFVPGFCRTLGDGSVLDHTHGEARRLAWAILIASSTAEALSTRPRFDISAESTVSWPNSQNQFAQAAQSQIRRLPEDDVESKFGLKRTAAIIDVLDESAAMLRVLHSSPFRDDLIASFQQVSRRLAKVPQASAQSSANPQQDEVSQEDGGINSTNNGDLSHTENGNEPPLAPDCSTQAEDEEAQVHADSIVRVRLLAKRFVCKLQGAAATKAD